MINPQFDYATSFSSNGLARVKLGGQWGYINKTGSYIINPQFDFACNFQSGAAVVKVGDKYGLIDESGKYLISPQYTDFGTHVMCNRIWFADDAGKNGFLDVTGKVVIPAQFDDFRSGVDSKGFYSDGYAIVRMGDKFGIIAKDGKYLVNPQFDGIDGIEIASWET